MDKKTRRGLRHPWALAIWPRARPAARSVGGISHCAASKFKGWRRHARYRFPATGVVSCCCRRHLPDDSASVRGAPLGMHDFRGSAHPNPAEPRAGRRDRTVRARTLQRCHHRSMRWSGRSSKTASQITRRHAVLQSCLPRSHETRRCRLIGVCDAAMVYRGCIVVGSRHAGGTGGAQAR